MLWTATYSSVHVLVYKLPDIHSVTLFCVLYIRTEENANFFLFVCHSLFITLPVDIFYYNHLISMIQIWLNKL